MAEKDRMPEVNLEKDKANLKHTAVDYMKLMEKINLDRAQKLHRIRRNNLITGWLLGGAVLSIYVYSMVSVKQEVFLDDFNEPETVSEYCRNLQIAVVAVMPSPKVLRLPPLPTIRDLIRLYRLRALRQLSQNFLMDQRLIDKIVKAAGRIRDGHVCEVGPGPGGITRSIIGRGPERVVVIEKDRRFIPMLELLKEACDGKMEVIIGDVLSFNMEKMFPEEMRVDWDSQPPNVHLIGNLPFSVSTPLIIRWLEDISEKRNAWSYGRVPMTLTFQKEVAERMVSPVTTSQRCRLSVMCQNWCNVQHVFTIPGSAFLPKPDVDVGVVHFEPKIEPIIQLPFKMIEKVVRSIFSFRQKYSIRGAETLFPVAQRSCLGTEMYQLAEVDPQTRPFQLTVAEFGRLCMAYQRICERDPRLFKYNARSSKKDLFIGEDEVQEDEGQPLVAQDIWRM